MYALSISHKYMLPVGILVDIKSLLRSNSVKKQIYIYLYISIYIDIHTYTYMPFRIQATQVE